MVHLTMYNKITNTKQVKGVSFFMDLLLIKRAQLAVYQKTTIDNFNPTPSDTNRIIIF